jgi:TRAP-type mannitol/chloroaromatic compound transport system substrate-binding protein
MQSIQQQLKNASVNGVIHIDKVTAIVAAFDAERTATVYLLKACERNVGMDLGESINSHVAKMTGGHFNVQEYHAERLPGEQ